MATNETAVTIQPIKKEVGPIEKDHASFTMERGYELDVLSQFRANLQQVEDLSHRLRHVMGEVSGLISKR